MLVFYVAQFVRGYESCVVWALRDRGIEVRTYNWNWSPEKLLIDIESSRPDLVLFSKPEPLRCNQLLDFCRSRGIPTLAWIWDLYWGYRSNRPQQFHSDVLLTTDGGHQREFDKLGCNHSVLKQGIHKPEHIYYPRNPVLDVAFVGHGGGKYYAGRRQLLAWLRRTYGIRFKHYTNTRNLDLNKALSKVKVIVGDSYPSPNYWSNRIYEITGRGGFLLHPKTEGLDEEFIDKKHYVAYERGNFLKLKHVVDYWISHDTERDSISLQGFNHCGSNYTYSHRVSRLLEVVEQWKDHHDKD